MLCLGSKRENKTGISQTEVKRALLLALIMKKQKWLALTTMGLVVSSMGFGVGEVALASPSHSTIITEGYNRASIETMRNDLDKEKDKQFSQCRTENVGITLNSRDDSEYETTNSVAKSSVVLSGIKGVGVVGPGNNSFTQERLARRAAEIDAVARAVKKTDGAKRGVVREITSEKFDGKTYKIVADVQVWN